MEAFETNWIAPLGPNVDKFERRVADYTGAEGALALSSGTAAIHLALKYFGVEQGDYVFCSALTFIGTCNSIIYENAIPVFIDSEPESWNMSPVALEAAFKSFAKRGKLPKAVITVNLYGQSADYDKILPMCEHYGIPVIEDAAESLGATYGGQQTGTLGQVGVFSFNGNKIITTSGGGMLVSDDLTALKKMKFWATQAREPLPYYEHKEIGYNYRMSNVVAAIGCGQMKVLAERIRRKKEIFETYTRELEGIPEIQMMPIRDYGEPNYWLTVITLAKNSRVRPQDLIARLEQANIEARHVWKPMHLQPVFKDCEFFRHDTNEAKDTKDTKDTNDTHDVDVAEDLFQRGVCLPSGTQMSDEDLNRVISLIKGCFS